MSYRLALIPAVLFAALVLGDPERLDSAQAGSDSAETKAAASLAEATKLLGAGKYKEARNLLAPLLKDDGKNRDDRDRALYYHGFACFMLKEDAAAGRSLSRLAPFEQAPFGLHARYLLARVHHRQDEKAEAVAQYQAVLAAHETAKSNAAEALKQPDALKDDPGEKARLEAIVAAPTPDFVSRAAFYLGVLDYEAGRFAEARSHFADFLGQQQKSPLKTDARLFQGMCEVQMQLHADAVETLTPLAEDASSKSAWALWWLGKAQAGNADPDDEEAVRAALAKGIAAIRRAADSAKQGKEPEGEILLDLAELDIAAGEHKEAAALFGQVLDKQLLPTRAEEILQRDATALNLAGEYVQCEKACAKFEKAYPRSPLLPEILFRRAESAAFLARSDPKEAARLEEIAASAYRRVFEQYPDFHNANLARNGLALVQYRREEYDKARTVLEGIPAVDYGGELVYCPLLLADCLIRTTAAKADDALAAGRIEEQLTHAAALLEEFADRQPDDPHVPDALLRLGLCRQRLAAQIAQPEERKKMLEAARETYDRILVDYPLNDVRTRAAFERARCLARLDDQDGAINRLRPFASDPLAKDPIAPLAVLQMATLLRSQDNKAAIAAKLLAACRKRHEKSLHDDPARASWVPLLLFHHAAALQEAGQFAEARALFDAVIHDYPERPEAADALLFRGQCLRDEGGQKVDQANQLLGAPDTKPPAAEAARKSIEEGQRMIREAAEYFEKQAAAMAKKDPVPEVRARLLYQAAWSYRNFGNDEADAVRKQKQEELRTKVQKEAAAKVPEGRPPPEVPPPDVPLAKVDVQPSEKKARALYQELIDAFPDLPLANRCRLELAEHHAARDDFAPAIKLLKDGLDREPAPELSDRLRLRLGACLSAQGNAKAALTQFEAVARNPEGEFAAHARYLAADNLLGRSEWEPALKYLMPFRDEEKFQNAGVFTNLSLVRLGHALASLKRWDDSRKTLAQQIERFPDDVWTAEAHYATGWGWQQEKKYDEALEAYAPLLAGVKSPAVARAQVQTGVCLLLRKKFAESIEALSAVSPEFPDLYALALLELAHAHARLKQTDQATRLLQQVVKDYPKTAWADAAKKELDKPASLVPHELPEAVRLLTPDLKDAWTLDSLGQMQNDGVPLDDPTIEPGDAATLARPLPQPQRPAAWLRLTLPEPFEFRLPLRPEDLPAEEPILPKAKP
jgi:TolA-binding protein